MTTITQSRVNDFERDYTLYHTAATTPGLTQASATASLQKLLSDWKLAVENTIANNQNDMTSISQKAAILAEQKQILKELKSKQITRDEQASSVNPKITQSPYVNILGLRRNFRYSTRVGLIEASVAFGALALGALGYYISTLKQSTMNESPILAQTGGRRVK
jgi:phage-related minor tail protein